MLKEYKIKSRRYIGSKTKLLNEIMSSIPKDAKKIVDLFSGTGVVASEMLNHGYEVVVNDLLYSNYIVYQAFFGKGEISKKNIIDCIEGFNIFKPTKQNYVSKNFGDKYFSKETAKKIGWIRDEIDVLFNDKKINQSEKYILIASLMYSMDRFANTVGHYEMYLKKEIKNEKIFNMGIIDLEQRNSKIEIFNMDANKLVKQIKADTYYIDPPYNARQYINFYHVWENIAKNEKPALKWESMKFDRTGLKSKYSSSAASEQMQDLFENIKKAKNILVSYNNTYNAKSGASNNKISEEQMEKIFSEQRKLKIHKIHHAHFNAGKTDFNDHKEYIYISTTK